MPSYFDTPGANDNPSQSQSEIQTNFSTINTDFSVNHIPFGTTNEGKHSFVEMPALLSDAITSAGEGAIYTLDAGGGLGPQLYYRLQSNGTVIKMTNAFSGNSVDGSCVIPGGLKIKWGNRTGLVDNDTITFAVPFSTTCYNVQLTLASTTLPGSVVQVYVFNLTSTTFKIRTNGTISLYFVAIGV